MVSKLFFAILCFLLLFSLFLVGSVGASSEMWSRTYGGTSSDSAEALVQTSDGGYTLAGYTASFSTGPYHRDFWLVKTDVDGLIQWNQTYGGDGDEAATSLVQTIDGGYAIAGYSIDFESLGNGNFWLVKTDSNGVMEWNQTYDKRTNELAHSLVQTSDGGYALVGGSSYNSGFYPPLDNWHYDAWLVKTDAHGNIQWNQTYDGGAAEEALSVIQTSDRGYAIAGYTNSSGSGRGDFWLIKTDEWGNVKWNQTYGGEEMELARSLIQASDGGYVLAGYTESFGAGASDFWLVKTDTNGNIEWNHTYGGIDNDRAFSVVGTLDGGYAITGESLSFSINSTIWLVKTDAFGHMLWNQTYGGEDNEYVSSVIETSDGGYALAGNTNSYGAGEKDLWLIKTDGNGIPEFPSWIVLPLFLIATLAVISYRKKMKN